MYKVIDKYNKIFKSNKFQKDKYKFYIVLKILTGDNPIIYSNEEDYFEMGSLHCIETKEEKGQDER